MPSESSSNETKFEFYGFYRQGYLGGPKRPFIRVFVALHRFGVSKQVDMLVDSGSDLTTLQPKDSLLMLKKSDFMQLGPPRAIQGIGGRANSYTEEGAIGFSMPDARICWVPINIDITDPNSRSTVPSTLGNDVLGFGTTVIDAIGGIVKIELWLDHPLITVS